MSDKTHRGNDPEAYEDTTESEPTLGRECPYCSKEPVLLPYHLPSSESEEIQ